MVASPATPQRAPPAPPPSEEGASSPVNVLPPPPPLPPRALPSTGNNGIPLEADVALSKLQKEVNYLKGRVGRRDAEIRILKDRVKRRDAELEQVGARGEKDVARLGAELRATTERFEAVVGWERERMVKAEAEVREAWEQVAAQDKARKRVEAEAREAEATVARRDDEVRRFRERVSKLEAEGKEGRDRLTAKDKESKKQKAEGDKVQKKLEAEAKVTAKQKQLVEKRDGELAAVRAHLATKEAELKKCVKEGDQARKQHEAEAKAWRQAEAVAERRFAKRDTEFNILDARHIALEGQLDGVSTAHARAIADIGVLHARLGAVEVCASSDDVIQPFAVGARVQVCSPGDYDGITGDVRDVADDRFVVALDCGGPNVAFKRFHLAPADEDLTDPPTRAVRLLKLKLSRLNAEVDALKKLRARDAQVADDLRDQVRTQRRRGVDTLPDDEVIKRTVDLMVADVGPDPTELKKLIRCFHPDKNPSKTVATAMMQTLLDATAKASSS